MDSDKKVLVTVIGIIAAVLLLTCGIIYFINDKKEAASLGSTEVTQKVDVGSTYNKPNDAKVSYDKETKIAYISSDKLGNPSNNTYNIKYFVILKSTGETIYESDYIAPGTTMDKLEFPYDAESGSYEVYLQVESFEVGTNVDHGGALYPLKLVIE